MSLAACSNENDGLLQGWVEGEYVYVAAPLAGRLEVLAADKGGRVAAGDALFALESTPEAAAVAEAEERLVQARAQLEDLGKGARPSEVAALTAQLDQAVSARNLAATEYRRRRDLYDEQTISAEELDRARAEYLQTEQQVNRLQAELETARLGGRSDALDAARAEVAAQEARLAQARWNLDQKTVAAPRSGLVFDTYYDPGEWVPAGQPVVSLLPPENVVIRFFVPQDQASAISRGQALTVQVDGLGAVPAHVTWISPQVEFTPPVIYSSRSRAKLVIMIEAEPDDSWSGELHPGQPVDVLLTAQGSLDG